MEIIKMIDSDKTKYMELLLIADEQVSMIEKYLYRGEMFVLYDEDVKEICVVTQEQSGVYEIKNMVTVPKYQRKGYGKYLISCIVDRCKKSGGELYVRTGNNPEILHFYEACGLTRSHIVKNFFVDNYDHPIYENGQPLVDMIYLKFK